MATYADREAFIPVTRDDLIALCLRDGRLPADQVEPFRRFYEVLQAFLHFRFHRHSEALKRAFRPFNPDHETRPLDEPTPEDRKNQAEQLVESFREVMREANFKELDAKILDQALHEESPLMKIRTQVRLDEFEYLAFYYRGQTNAPTQIGRLWWRKTVEIETFTRVALLLKFQEAEYFKARKQNPAKLPFVPGQLLLYLYKDVPRLDLELLFPNVRLRMNPKDLALLIVPALGAGIATLLKILPSLLLIVGVILLVTFGEEAAKLLGVNSDALAATLPVLLAAVSAGAALAGYASGQYLKFTNKRLAFQKKVVDTLFFKNLANNEGVLTGIVDNAEEEECKELLLIYYHLLTADRPLTKAELDDRIEQWMQQTLARTIDFDIQKGLDNLAALSAPIGDGSSGQHLPLLSEATTGHLQVRPLTEAIAVLDYVWDNIVIVDG